VILDWNSGSLDLRRFLTENFQEKYKIRLFEVEVEAKTQVKVENLKVWKGKF
jgi:hypothetical protein